ncbi:hypothetical protein ACP70R_021950 [Stipagrostis hirtigluma subsp. patula]
MRVPRRLQNLNFEVQVQENEQEDEDTMQGPPEHYTAVSVTRPIQNKSFKIIWPNGAVREIFRSFRTAELWDLNGGRVLVETDDNGIPNQWSESILSTYLGELAQNSSFAPLHIPRWDSKLFKGPKERIITDVEKKFVYSMETKMFTRDWILKTVNKRWRDYKSDLKKKYYNPDERTLEQIEKDVPDTVNENQWSSLLGLWCSETHKKLCRTNAESGKKLRHPHTSGRKSHARLKKEMEDKKNEKVSKIDLWDESHKKKTGNYVNQNVQRLMDKAFDELENRRRNTGTLCSRDYDDVFHKVIGKELKHHGYYDDQYWSQGSDFGVQSEEDKILKRDLRLAISEFTAVRRILEKKFPEEDWRSKTAAIENATVTDRPGNENISEEYFNTEVSNQERPYSPDDDQMHFENCTGATKGSVDPSITNRNTVLQESQTEESAKVIEDGSNGSSSPYGERISMGPQRKILKQKKSQKKQKMVLLFSTREGNEHQVVAIGNLISRDSTDEIDGTVLGDGYYSVAIHRLNNVEDERLPRPYGDIKTLEDAVGLCVAWPHTHLKRVKPTTKKRA